MVTQGRRVFLVVAVGLTAVLALAVALNATSRTPSRLLRHLHAPASWWLPGVTARIHERESAVIAIQQRRLQNGARVVLLGDSLTAWNDWTRALKRDDVANLGVPGDTTFGMRARLQSAFQPKPRALVVMGGVNDLLLGVPVADIADLLDGIVADAQTLGIPTLVLATLHVAPPLTNASSLNRDIAALVRTAEPRVRARGATWVDLNGELAPQGTLLAPYHHDGVHLTPAGYVPWAQAVGAWLHRAAPLP